MAFIGKMHHAAARCNALQRTAAHCNTLQHTFSSVESDQSRLSFRHKIWAKSGSVFYQGTGDYSIAASRYMLSSKALRHIVYGR